MKRVVWVALGVATVVSSAEALRSGAASASEQHRTMTRAEYAAAMSAIEAASADEHARCESRAGADREICRAQADATDLTRTAQVETQFRRSPEAARGAQRARIEARYLLQRARCGALTGARKDQCFIQAHALRGRALLEAAQPYEELASS